jgi:hypothetical protein
MRKRSSHIIDQLLSASEFQALGADEQGVPHYRSKYKGLPPDYVCWLPFLGGIFFFTLGIMAAEFGYKKDTPVLWLGLLGCLGGLGAIGCGWWMLDIRKRFATLTSQENTCSQLGISQEELKLIASSKGIRPSCNINGNDYYNLSDFDDSASLLRASGQPASQPETLLRPAANTSETPPEQLLRMSGTGQ